MTLADFALAVVTYRDRTSASVTSWGRTPLHNRHVGGIGASDHLIDLAVDVVYDHLIDLHSAREFAADLGLAVHREPDHDHLSPLPT